LAVQLDVGEVPRQKRVEFVVCVLTHVKRILWLAIDGLSHARVRSGDEDDTLRVDDAAELGEEAIIVVNMLNRLERNDHICSVVSERQCSSVGADDGDRRYVASSCGSGRALVYFDPDDSRGARSS
jgi:hypothetical protein